MCRLKPLLIAAALLLGTAASSGAQVVDGFATLPYLAETDPDAALDRIGAALDAMEQGQAVDPKVLYDLYRMAADLLIEGGQAAQSAQIIARLADLAVQYRDFLGLDPLPVYAEAAALLRDTGQARAARDTLVSMYEEQRISGAAPEDLTRTARDIAGLSQALGEATPELAEPLSPENFQTISISYATDRGISGEPAAPLYYGADSGALEVGTATVSYAVTPGAADVSKLRALRPVAEANWPGALDSAPKQGLLLYIPGAATPFEQAARRVALIAEGLGGVEHPVLYSWPASGSTLDYMSDSAATRRSARHLAQLLEDLIAQPGHPRPHLLARGMGAQVLTDALELIAAGRAPEAPPPFGQLILAAPDMDADRLRDLLPVLRPLVRRITIYASEKDREMALARRLYGPALRAGWGGEATLLHELADSLDVSALQADMLTAPAVLADMAMLLWKDAAPDRRCGLTPVPGGAGEPPVWRFADGADGICSDPVLAGVLARLRRDDIEAPDQALEVMRAAVADPGLRAELAPVLSRLIRP